MMKLLVFYPNGSPLFRGAARYLNTDTRRPAALALADCCSTDALPGHKLRTHQRHGAIKTYGRKKPRLSGEATASVSGVFSTEGNSISGE